MSYDDLKFAKKEGIKLLKKVPYEKAQISVYVQNPDINEKNKDFYRDKLNMLNELENKLIEYMNKLDEVIDSELIKKKCFVCEQKKDISEHDVIDFTKDKYTDTCRECNDLLNDNNFYSKEVYSETLSKPKKFYGCKKSNGNCNSETRKCKLCDYDFCNYHMSHKHLMLKCDLKGCNTPIRILRIKYFL